MCDATTDDEQQRIIEESCMQDLIRLFVQLDSLNRFCLFVRRTFISPFVQLVT